MVTLLFTSDTGTGDDAQRAVAALLERLARQFDAQAVVLCGDNFMDFGVTGPHDPQWQSKFEMMYSSQCLARLPFWSVLGNHDYKGNPRSQLDYARTSQRWRMPARHYLTSFDDMVSLAAIDTNWPDYSGIGLLSMDRVARRSGRSPLPWKVVVGHRPLLTGGKYERVPWNVQWFLRSFIRQARASLYFSGHDHNLQHLVDDVAGIHQVVCGAGGSPLQPVRWIEGRTRFAQSVHGAVVARFTAIHAEFLFFGVESDAPLYRFQLEAAPNKGGK